MENRKIVIVGPEKVGKTQLSNRITNKKYVEGYSATIGVELTSCTIDNDRIQLAAWTTSGAEKYFRIMIPQYFKDAAAIIVVIDPTLPNINSYLQQINQNIHITDKNSKIFFVVNKIDLDEAKSFDFKENCQNFINEAKDNYPELKDRFINEIIYYSAKEPSQNALEPLYQHLVADVQTSVAKTIVSQPKTIQFSTANENKIQIPINRHSITQANIGSQINKTVLIIGSPEAGKTQLLNRLAKNNFSENYTKTIGFDYKSVDIGNLNITLWDSLGEEKKLGTLIDKPLRKASAIVIVIDPTKSLNCVATYLDLIQKGLKTLDTEIIEKPTIFFVANKMDREEIQKEIFENEWATYFSDLKNNYPDLIFNEKIIHYSCKDPSEYELKNTSNDPEFFKNPILNALYRHFSPQPKAQETNNQHSTTVASIKFSSLFKLFILFAVLSTLFIAAGGLTGGLEQIWSNMDSFFEAIKLMTNWGIGVVAASIGSAFVITSAVAAYYAYSNKSSLDGGENIRHDNGPIPQGVTSHNPQSKTINYQQSPISSSTLQQQPTTIISEILKLENTVNKF